MHVKEKVRNTWFASEEAQNYSKEAPYVVLGAGYIRLLTDRQSLLADMEHVVMIHELAGRLGEGGATGSETVAGKKKAAVDAQPPPVLRVSTRSQSSFVSSCPRVQGLLLAQPTPLGRLRSSQMALSVEDIVMAKPPTEANLEAAISGIQSGDANEISGFFLVS